MENESEAQPLAFMVMLFISWTESCWEGLDELLLWDNQTPCCVSLLKYASFFDI